MQKMEEDDEWQVSDRWNSVEWDDGWLQEIRAYPPKEIVGRVVKETYLSNAHGENDSPLPVITSLRTAGREKRKRDAASTQKRRSEVVKESSSRSGGGG